MTSRTLKICIGAAGHEVGTLYFDAKGARQASVFRYAQSWREGSHGFDLSPYMPRTQEQYTTAKALRETHSSPLPAPIADTSPDDWGRRVIRRDNQRTSATLTDLDFLIGVDDYSRLGAIRIADENGTFLRSAANGRPITPPLLELADLQHAVRAVEKRTETDKDLARLRGVGSSLGGARPKCSVRDTDGSLLIAKFQTNGEANPTEKAEVLALRLAKAVGLTAPDARLADTSGDPIALIKRFDRTPDGKRLYYISAQTMLDVVPGGEATYTEIAAAIREHCVNPVQNLRELFARVAFTVLISNVDDHLKNHGFLYAGQGKWTLSPVFDVNPAPERDGYLKTWISEARGDEASIEAALEAAPQFDLSWDQAARLVGTMAATIKQRWRRIAQEIGMTSREIADYVPAFEHDQSKFALGLHADPHTPEDESGGAEDTSTL